MTAVIESDHVMYLSALKPEKKSATFVRQSYFCETVSLFCDNVDRALNKRYDWFFLVLWAISLFDI